MSTTKSKTRLQIEQLLKQNPTLGRYKIAATLGLGSATVQAHLCAIRAKPDPKKYLDSLRVHPEVLEAPEPLSTSDLALLAHKALHRGPLSAKSLADEIGCSPDRIDEVLSHLMGNYNIQYNGALIYLERPPFGRLSIDNIDSGAWTRVGLVGDTHLACKEERLAVLHAQYDLYEREGITQVFHAGNIVDGYVPKINGASAIVTTIDDQAFYVVDNYPQRKGITTYYITGDDHEGWWIKEGFNFGKYLEMLAKEAGRDDLKYIGHVEGDVEFKSKAGSAIMKIQHPGGGSSYARSYKGQKTVESMEGGEKPAILVQGHYHVHNYCCERNIHIISLPGFQDQTVFGRKLNLRMEIGGAILEFKQSPNDGTLTRCRVEYNRYYDRGYYKVFLRSDARVIKGHIVIEENTTKEKTTNEPKSKSRKRTTTKRNRKSTCTRSRK